MNFDILGSLGGVSKSYGEKKYAESLLNLQSKYPNLCGLSKFKSKKSPKSSNPTQPPLSLSRSRSIPTSTSTNQIGIGLTPLEIQAVSSPSLPTFRKPVDLSGSKLALMDQPGHIDPTPTMGRRKIKAIKKKLRDRTKGPKWFDMTAPEITEDRKNDLEALKMRSALDTKTKYKRNSVPIKPKHFHVGKIIEGKADFYNSRLTKKQRKRTIAEELMAELNN